VLQYYSHCLEDVEEFHGLRDYFETFRLYRGKKSMDDEDDDANRMAGYFKVMVCSSFCNRLSCEVDVRILGI